MSATIRQVLNRHETDHEDVRWALTTASALWARGACEDAVRWLRRAGEAATDADDDERALEIFKAAADIQSEVSAELASPRESRRSEIPPPSSPRSQPPPIPAAPRTPRSSPSTLPPPRGASPRSQPPPSARPSTRPSASLDHKALPSVPPRPRPTPAPPKTCRAIVRGGEVKALRVAAVAVGNGEVRLVSLPSEADVPEGMVGAVLVPMVAGEIDALIDLFERRTTH